MEIMNTLEKIHAKEALERINTNQELKNCYVYGRLDLGYERQLLSPLIILNSYFEDLYCPSVEFFSEVRFKDSCFLNATFLYSYFIQGLIIDNCKFHSYIDFQAGGHNLKPILIENSIFDDFVNFFDCWFKSDLAIKNNTFKKGTNLLGNRGEHFEVKFEIEPIVQDNKGAVDLDGEGV